MKLESFLLRHSLRSSQKIYMKLNRSRALHILNLQKYFIRVVKSLLTVESSNLLPSATRLGPSSVTRPVN